MGSFVRGKTAARLSTSESPLVEGLGRLSDAAILGVLLIAPLFMGGRGPVGKLVLILLVSVASISWFAREYFSPQAKWRWSGAEILLLLGGAVAILQLLPLPQSILFRISPALAELLPLWQPDAPTQLGKWNTISLTPEDTRGGLIMYFGYVIFFFVLMQRLRTIPDVAWLLRCLAIAAVGMACVGMLQLLFGNGKFLWVYEHPSRNTFEKVNGTFQNQNHFAHFLALGIGPLIWWVYSLWTTQIQRRESRREAFSSMPNDHSLAKHLGAIGLGIVFMASLLTWSRGGVICVGLVTLTIVLIYWWKSFLGRKSLLAVGLFALIVSTALGIYGYQQLSRRIGTLAAGSLDSISPARLELWKAQWQAIPQFPWFGTGVGSHREVYPIYLEQYYDLEFTHGESGYFELLLETGFIGGLLMLCGFGIALRWCVSVLVAKQVDRRLVEMAGAVIPGILVSLIHSTCDFVWYIPGCMSLTIALACCACRLFQFARTGSDEEVASSSRKSFSLTSPMPRWAVTCLLFFAGATAGLSIQNRLGPALAAPSWDAYLRLALVKENAVQDSAERDKLAEMERLLQRVLHFYPNDARASLRLGAVHLRRFELEQRFSQNSMGLTQIRDAALASQFPSYEAQLAWLRVAFRDHHQRLYAALKLCKRALRLSPLQGPGYIYAADLCFLESPRDQVKHDLVKQAALVRPHSGLVLLALGKETVLTGDLNGAIAYWRKAFQNDPEVRVQIIESLAEVLPVDFFLGSFKPDCEGLQSLFTYYRAHERPDEARQVGQQLASALRDKAEALGKDAARTWIEAQDVYCFLGNLPEAIQCQQRAVGLAPSDYSTRRCLGTLLSRNQQYAEAAQSLEWCLRRRPEDATLKQELAEIQTHLSAGDRAAARTDRSLRTESF